MERAQNKHGFGLMAVSLGYFETLMSLSGTSTSSELTLEERATAGVSWHPRVHLISAAAGIPVRVGTP